MLDNPLKTPKCQWETSTYLLLLILFGLNEVYWQGEIGVMSKNVLSVLSVMTVLR